MNDFSDIKYLLDDRAKKYNNSDFIGTDPIQIPHMYSKKEDIEISGLLTSTIAWGQRKSIIKNSYRLMELMDNSPYEFILNLQEENSVKTFNGIHSIENSDYKRLKTFVHRTFNGNDCVNFIKSIRNIYINHGGLESVFTNGYVKEKSVLGALINFRKIFLENLNDKHITKHVSDAGANSAAKRLNMFLRWMVRSDDYGVDFGLWHSIQASDLMLPLDVHTAEVGRALGILSRTQNDWKAVNEITNILRQFDPADPIRYDFALFGIGAFETKDKYLSDLLYQ